MTNALEIERITIIIREGGTDLILMRIKGHVQPVWPDTEQLVVTTNARANHGEQWVNDTFPEIPYNVINSRG